jgi:hypothetical protein
MIETISRDICIIKYRNLALTEYEEVTDELISHFPETHAFYWLKLSKACEDSLPNQISLILKHLNIERLVFLGEMNKPWISKLTASRKDFKPLVKAVTYFKSHGIEEEFNGGVIVDDESIEELLGHFQTITTCDGGFSDFNFIDENQNYWFYIHYSGELRVLMLNENADADFLKSIKQTHFINSETASTNRI